MLEYDCVKANTGNIVSVLYSTKSLSCNVTYRVEGKGDLESEIQSVHFSTG